jgi:Holliday junction resolvase RusA-like endonuclease
MIRLDVPWIPPSSNHAYLNMRGRGRILTKVGREFLTTTTAHFSQNYPKEMRIFKPNKPYVIALRFHLEQIENSGFTTGKAASRYKHIDVDNRLKLLIDALKEAGGIDDSQFLSMHPQKVQGTPERSTLWVWSLEEESCPFNDVFDRLT